MDDNKTYVKILSISLMVLALFVWQIENYAGYGVSLLMFVIGFLGFALSYDN